jgi:alcohol dehydrogenase class IV
VNGARVDPSRPFRWHDGERTILYGPGCLEEARDELGPGFTLLTTQRALASVPWLGELAQSVHIVQAGRVDAAAGALRAEVRGERLVAVGGGRVIDTAKALAAADPPRHVVAIPTTLSGAEMTPIHRHAEGVATDAPRVRPRLVINDPGLSATQPVAELAASAANALGHALEGPLTPLGNPVASMAAAAAVQELEAGLAGVGNGADPDRPALALGSLLAGYVIGSTHYGLHHVLSQTLVRLAGIPHGRANAIMLPHSLEALSRRFPRELERLAGGAGRVGGGAPGGARGDLRELAARFAGLSGCTRLRDANVEWHDVHRCAQEAATRPELALTPPAADAHELRELLEAAY